LTYDGGRIQRRRLEKSEKMNAAMGHVRRAGIEDAPDIAAVHVRSWQGAYRGLLPQDYLDQLDPASRLKVWEDAALNADWPRNGVLVAVLDGSICGFAGFGATRDTDGDQQQVGEVFAIYLHPQAWGKGLGRSLMADALGNLAAAGYTQATLWVLDSNARAREFYAKGGWVEDGAVKLDDSRGFPISEVRYRRQLP
jgi:ribosomal protein S18 acetylase RimI-like enzyme